MKLGDMVDIKHNQYLKGPNAFSPCRKCRIQGCQDPNYGPNHYYYPLTAPEGVTCLNGTQATNFDPRNLPMRTETYFKEALLYIREAPTKKEKSRRSKVHGLKGESILVTIPGFSRVKVCRMISCICSSRMSFQVWLICGVGTIRV